MWTLTFAIENFDLPILIRSLDELLICLLMVWWAKGEGLQIISLVHIYLSWKCEISMGHDFYSFSNFHAHVEIVPLKCFMKLFVSIVGNKCASNFENPINWVDMVPAILKVL